MQGKPVRYFFGTRQSEDNVKQLRYKLKQSEEERLRLSSLCRQLQQNIENKEKDNQYFLSLLEQEQQQFKVQYFSLVANELRELIESSQEQFSQQLKSTQEELEAIQNRLNHLQKEQLKNNQYILNRLIELLQGSFENSSNNRKETNQQEDKDLTHSEHHLFVDTQSYQPKENFKNIKQYSSFFDDNSKNFLQDNRQNTSNISSFLRKPEDLANLLTNYNSQTARILFSHITKVDSTPESIEGKRSGAKPPMFFTAITNGIYWLVNQPSLQDNHFFLVPQAGLVINDANYQTLEGIFNCDGYANRTSNKFQLISPAIVKKLSHDKWQLIEPGKLMF